MQQLTLPRGLKAVWDVLSCVVSKWPASNFAPLKERPCLFWGVVLVLVICLVHIEMLAFVGFVAVIVFRPVSAQCVACCRSSFLSLIIFTRTLSYLHAHLPAFFRSGVSKDDLTSLLMCWLTDLGMSSWST